MSVYVRLRDSQADAITALGLSLNGKPLFVRKLKLPVQRESIDSFPCCLVVIGDGPESSVPFHTGGVQLVGYLLQVVILSGTARQPKDGEGDLLDARESVRKLMQRPTTYSGVSELLRVEPLPQAPIGRASWLKTFEASALAVRLFCVENAT